MNLDWLARTLITFGVLFILLGAILLLAGRVPFLGRLPGDLSFQRPNFSFYFPLTTSLLISLGLSIVLNIILRLLGK